MNAPQRYQLIDGTFTAEQATHVLLSLVQSKINHHNLEKLSNQERFGSDVTRSETRLAELHELRDALRSACRSLAESGMHARISGWIEVQPVAPEAEATPRRSVRQPAAAT